MPGDRSSEQGGLSEERVREIAEDFGSHARVFTIRAVSPRECATVEALAREWLAQRAELAEWRDPDSERRQALTEEIILALGDGARSEIDLREAQLDRADAALKFVQDEARDEIAELRAQLAEKSSLIEECRRLLGSYMDDHGAIKADWDFLARLDAAKGGG